jgi:hypothetical protein
VVKTAPPERAGGSHSPYLDMHHAPTCFSHKNTDILEGYHEIVDRFLHIGCALLNTSVECRHLLIICLHCFPVRCSTRIVQRNEGIVAFCACCIRVRSSTSLIKCRSTLARSSTSCVPHTSLYPLPRRSPCMFEIVGSFDVLDYPSTPAPPLYLRQSLHTPSFHRPQ